MKFTTGCCAAILAAVCLGGCSSEQEGDGRPPVIDTSKAPVPVVSESASNGIPSSGKASTKKKPDPVGAMSPIVPKR